MDNEKETKAQNKEEQIEKETDKKEQQQESEKDKVESDKKEKNISEIKDSEAKNIDPQKIILEKNKDDKITLLGKIIGERDKFGDIIPYEGITEEMIEKLNFISISNKEKGNFGPTQIRVIIPILDDTFRDLLEGKITLSDAKEIIENKKKEAAKKAEKEQGLEKKPKKIKKAYSNIKRRVNKIKTATRKTKQIINNVKSAGHDLLTAPNNLIKKIPGVGKVMDKSEKFKNTIKKAAGF